MKYNSFIKKELAKEFEVEFNCLEEKYKTFSVTVTKEVKWIYKNVEEITKTYLTNYNLLIAQDLWQAHYEILLIILLKEFRNLNANMDMIMKNVKHAEHLPHWDKEHKAI